jgi:hypothetical protein
MIRKIRLFQAANILGVRAAYQGYAVAIAPLLYFGSAHLRGR